MIDYWAVTIGDGEMILVVAIDLIVQRVVVVLTALKTLKTLTRWVPIEMASLLSKWGLMRKNELVWQEPRWILTVCF